MAELATKPINDLTDDEARAEVARIYDLPRYVVDAPSVRMDQVRRELELADRLGFDGVAGKRRKVEQCEHCDGAHQGADCPITYPGTTPPKTRKGS